MRDGVRCAGSLLVHCYGQGGEGVILSWGCALDVRGYGRAEDEN